MYPVLALPFAGIGSCPVLISKLLYKRMNMAGVRTVVYTVRAPVMAMRFCVLEMVLKKRRRRPGG